MLSDHHRYQGYRSAPDYQSQTRTQEIAEDDQQFLLPAYKRGIY